MPTYALSRTAPEDADQAVQILRDSVGVTVTLTTNAGTTPIFDIRQTAAVGVGTPASLAANTTITPLVAMHDDTTNAPGTFRTLKSGALTLSVSEAQTISETLHPWSYLKLTTNTASLVCDISAKS